MSRKKSADEGAEKREHPIEAACRLRGMTVQALCEQMGLSMIEMNVYTAGLRKASGELLGRIAKLLDVDEGFLHGYAKTVSFWDNGETAICAILLTRREDRGVFMIVQKPSGTFEAALQMHGKLFLAPCDADTHRFADIPAGSWADELGRPQTL